MYWNDFAAADWLACALINFNMGCIETPYILLSYTAGIRLTLTWDVLKLVFWHWSIKQYEINFNMGCIETTPFVAEVLTDGLD